MNLLEKVGLVLTIFGLIAGLEVRLRLCGSSIQDSIFPILLFGFGVILFFFNDNDNYKQHKRLRRKRS